MSQIGTRVTALLDNERDINAVLTGISGAQSLRQVLARLDTKQQAIIMGHAVPMPVVVKTRNYDEEFYAAVTSGRVGGKVVPGTAPDGPKHKTYPTEGQVPPLGVERTSNAYQPGTRWRVRPRPPQIKENSKP